ncbi:MAG: YidC/Oxa1 family membrane protein insertase [Oscillospiraceae bacterium]
MGIISEIIGYPLGWIMWLIYQICHNYAFSIIIFTLITKIIMFPLSVKTQKSSAAMQAMQPKLEKIKKQYGNNQEKVQEATMQLYNEEGVNPMASCLPMFIQFPILYGIFDVVYRPITHILRIKKDVITEVTEIVKNMSYGAEKHFSVRPELYILQAVKEQPEAFGDYPDLVEAVQGFSNTLLGADMGATPSIHPEVWDSAAVILFIIPILSGLFQLIMSVYSQIRQKKMSGGTNPAGGSMTMMLYIMPIFSVWIAYSFPAAIGFYWAMSSFFGLVQQIVLNKIYTPEYVGKLLEKDRAKRKNSKKKGIMDRYQQMVAEQMAAQNGGKAPSGNTVKAKLSDDDDGGEVKLSKSKQKEYERMLIREARRRQAEKYGDEYTDDDDD